jgi:hypothetical protein
MEWCHWRLRVDSGFIFGVITSSRTDAPASWGDAYVVALDGMRAGIVWVMKGPVTEVVFPSEPRSWGSAS